MALTVMPRNVVLFERLGYFTVLFGGATSMWVNWQIQVKFYTISPISYPLLQLVVFPIQIGWIWMTARKRQSWARWPSVVLLGIGILATISNAKLAFENDPAAEIVKIVLYLLWIVAYSLLFTKQAKAWFVFPPSPAIDGEAVSPTEA